MKALEVVGTRPDLIKMAPVFEALGSAAMDTLVCATGQHREMLARALEVFSTNLDISLDMMRQGRSLTSLSSRLLADFDGVIQEQLMRQEFRGI